MNLRQKSQEATSPILTQRIAVLVEIIRWGNDESADQAGIQLALIGTKQAAEALMNLIRKNENPDLIEILAPLVVSFPFRDEYREELEELTDKELIAAAYEEVAKLDPRLLNEPTWLTVAKALEAQCICKQASTGSGIHFIR